MIKYFGKLDFKREQSSVFLTETKSFDTNVGAKIYYTYSSIDAKSIIENMFPNKPVRIYFDFKLGLYVLGDAHLFIHTDLIRYMISETNVYDKITKFWDKAYYDEETRDFTPEYISKFYFKENCALFQIVPTDNLKEYTQSDGYDHGWIAKYGDKFAICRNTQRAKVREVPLFDFTTLWYGVEYYMEKLKPQINESMFDIEDYDGYYEEYDVYNILSKFEYGEKNIWFPLIKPSEYKQALTEFMKMGELVRFPKDKVFKWLQIILKNTIILDNLTALAGHTQWFPFESVQEVYPEMEEVPTDYYKYSEFLEEKGFYEWARLPDGSPGCSDYGVAPLYKILNEYTPEMTAEQVLVLVNKCLDVYHHQGDLASAFIEGGSSSLYKISNESKQIRKRKIQE